MATPRVAAGALIFDDAGRVLIVQPSYKESWDIPGGYVEPGESPLDACVREVHEELGIKPPIGRLLVVDWAPHPNEGDKILYVFDGGMLSPEDRARIRLDRAELSAFEFREPRNVANVMPERLARRVALAATARDRGQTLYAEHGRLAESA